MSDLQLLEALVRRILDVKHGGLEFQRNWSIRNNLTRMAIAVDEERGRSVISKQGIYREEILYLIFLSLHTHISRE